jgi:hypothetical protein
LLQKDFSSEIDVKNADWLLSGSMAYEWFGHSTKAKLGYLAVGAPEARICAKTNCDIAQSDVQAVGRVYIFRYPSATPVAVLSGQTEYEQFGYSFDLSKQLAGLPVLAVGSMTKDTKLSSNRTSFELSRAGIVQLFKLDNPSSNATLMATLKSDRPYSAFGSRIRFQRVSDQDAYEDLFIGAHMRSEDILLLDQG